MLSPHAPISKSDCAAADSIGTTQIGRIAAPPQPIHLLIGDCGFVESVGKQKPALGRPASPIETQVAVYFGHVLFGLNYTELGAIFGCDRTTIRRFCHRVEDCRDNLAVDLGLTALEFGVEAWTNRFQRPCDLDVQA